MGVVDWASRWGLVYGGSILEVVDGASRWGSSRWGLVDGG